LCPPPTPARAGARPQHSNDGGRDDAAVIANLRLTHN
jgi:hypothetical protein